MSYDPGYTKANVTRESNAVLKTLAKEQKKYVYKVIDEVLREKFPDYFKKLNINTETMKKEHKKE